MKKIILTHLIVCFSLFTFAQNSFAPIGAQWYADFNSESHTGYSVYTVTKDTLINDIEARLIEGTHYKSDGIEILDSISSVEIVYPLKDTVFYYNSMSESFLPLYYFNVHEGTLLPFHESDAPNNIFEVKVDSINHLVTNGISLEVVHTSAINNWGIGSPESLPYTQTIGSLGVVGFSSLHVASPQLGNYFPPKLRCYIDQDINYQIDGLQDCEQLFPINIKEEELPFSNIKVYPNPTPGLFNLEIQDMKTYLDLTLHILDFTGKPVAIFTNFTDKTIDVSALPSGMYLIKILNDEQLITTQKLIKY